MQRAHFVALEGTRTFSLRFEDVFIPTAWILADPVGPYLAKIRSGSCLCRLAWPWAHPRLHCDHAQGGSDPQAPQQFLTGSTGDVRRGVGWPARGGPWPGKDALGKRGRVSTPCVGRTAQSRELSIQAAGAALLHAGARGYLDRAPAQRRLRESYFVALVTPAMKHLRKELASMDGECP